MDHTWLRVVRLHNKICLLFYRLISKENNMVSIGCLSIFRKEMFGIIWNYHVFDTQNTIIYD